MPNRNQISHFAKNPEVNIQRTRFPIEENIKFTGNCGDIIPFYCSEILPGDTFDIRTSLVCRMQTLIHPILDSLWLDTYYFFVPNRLVWDNWQHFCGEPDKAWLPSREYTIPQIKVNYVNIGATPSENPEEIMRKNAYAFSGSVLDYMGVALNPEGFIDSSEMQPNTYIGFYINALPVRAYNKIYDDWFRDENLIDPVNLYTGDNDVWSTFQFYFDPVSGQVHKSQPTSLVGGVCYKAAKYRDYFTAALPRPQRGDPVNLFQEITGSNTFAPVITRNDNVSSTMVNPLKLASTFDSNTHPAFMAPASNVMPSVENNWKSAYLIDSTGSYLGNNNLAPINLWADMSAIGSGDVSLTVNDLRTAFQVQRFMERSAMYGARYIELLKGMFGVTSPDARLQRSEYLGGHRIPINIHQIVNQTESMDAPLGNVGAMSLTSDTHNDFIHSFTEHGYVIGCAVVRFKNSYSQGLNRMWSRKTKYDFYWPVFANLGEQAVLNKEIFLRPDFYQDLSHADVVPIEGNDDVFAYQERWAEYRYAPDRIAGELRPGIINTLSSWHLGDYYDQLPTLSKEWIEVDKTNVDRTLAVTSSVADQFLFDVLVQNKATRPMPVYSIPGLADHH